MFFFLSLVQRHRLWVTDVAQEPAALLPEGLLQVAPLLQSVLVVQVQTPLVQVLVAGDGPGQFASVVHVPSVRAQVPLMQ